MHVILQRPICHSVILEIYNACELPPGEPEKAPENRGFRLHYYKLVGAKEQISVLKTYVQENARDWTPLVSGGRHRRARRASDWLLYVNAEVEPEA